MNFSLTKLLEKYGVSKVEELSPEEQATYRQYQVILSGKDVSVDMVKDFCRAQVNLIESKCDGVSPLTPIQQACLHVYLNLVKAIEAPEKEREAMEVHLTNLIKA